MEMPSVFDSSQLARIIEEAMIFQCVCPAQVAQHIFSLRELYRYQYSCSMTRSEDFGVHARIMESVQRTHAEMEQCLSDVLIAEGWDIATLTMPEGLRQLRDDLLAD
jgi:hypothetical protein